MGYESIAAVCPLGALESLFGAGAFVARAVIILAVAAAAVLLVGKAFCSWVCPIPPLDRFLSGKKRREADKAARIEAAHHVSGRLAACAGCAGCGEKKPGEPSLAPADGTDKRRFAKVDGRHVVLGGSLVSAAICGFPVFCLICPIGLTFATIVLVMRLFAFGDVAWGVILVPALLLAEVVFFRKWCSTFCPISAFMSLVGKANRTFVPQVNDAKCRETMEGASCEVCAAVCPQGINVRHPEAGMSFSECTKCRACVEACPTQAIKMPFLPQKVQGASTVVVEDEDAVTAS